MSSVLTASVARVVLRYVAMFLVTHGVFSAENGTTFASDPDMAALLETGIGMAISAATEVWWYFAMPSKEAEQAAKAVDKGHKVTVEGPLGGETVIQKEPK